MHRIKPKSGHINQALFRAEMAKAKLGDNIASHMAYIFMNILYDKFDLTFKQLVNFHGKTKALRIAWQDDSNKDVTSESLLKYCVQKKIDAVGLVKRIPMSQKLFLADLHKNRAVVGAERNIDSALLVTLLLTVPTLKETYRFSNKKIEEFFDWVEYFIDSYYRKQPGCKDRYLNDEMIRQIFIEDEHWDIVTGEKVD